MMEHSNQNDAHRNDFIREEVSNLLSLLVEHIDKTLHNNIDGYQSESVNLKEEYRKERWLESFTLLWCDSQVNSTDDNLQTQIELRQSIPFLKTFESPDLCKRYIEKKSNEQFILIISGSLGRDLVPDIHDSPQIITIYVFCLDVDEHETWARKYEKIKKVTSGRVQLLDSIVNDQAQRNDRLLGTENVDMAVFSGATLRNRTHEKVTSSREYSHQNLDHDFFWSQLIVDVILKMKDKLRENYFSIFIANCKKQYSGNSSYLNTVDELEEYYHAPAALFWYTRDSFLYRMLNRALRCRDDHTLMTLSFFIYDIHNSLKLQQKKLNNESKIVRVYRGQFISEIELDKLKNNIGQFVSMNSFFSTTRNRQMACEIYAGANKQRLNNIDECVLFEIDADTGLAGAKPFADITDRSAFNKEEQEILFMLGSIFKILNVTKDENQNLWIVKLELSNEEDNSLKPIFEYFRSDIPEEADLMAIGVIYYHMGRYFEAEEYFRKMLESLSEDDANLAGCYNNLGLIAYAGHADCAQALIYYSKALELELMKPLRHKYNFGNMYNNLGNVLKQQNQYAEALLHFSHVFTIDLDQRGDQGLLLATARLNCGLVYHEMGDYKSALENMNESLKINLQELPENHPVLASTYNYIGLVHQHTRNYEVAMTNFQKAIRIQLVITPNHPDTAITYNNMGMTYVLGWENYTEALVNYEKALKIFENAAFTSNHPGLISLLSNIGFLHRLKGNYDLALNYYKRALELQLALTPVHSTTAVIYNNLGFIYEYGYQNDSEALSNYRKAIDLSRMTLSANHPDLGKTLSRVADFYNRTEDYENALSTYQEALKIFSSSASDQLPVAATHAGLSIAYTNGFHNYIDALANLEKALSIYQDLGCPDEIDTIRQCFQQVQQLQEDDDPFEYLLHPNHRYSIRQLLPDTTILTNLNQDSGCISMSQFLRTNAAVALYFTDHSSQYSFDFTLKLAEIYKQMSSTSEERASVSFDIIYLWLFDVDEDSFNKQYQEMPWKTIPYGDRYSMILLQRLAKYFAIQRNPTFIVLQTATGEILSKDGCQAITQLGLRAIKSWCQGKKVTASQLSNEEYVWHEVSCDGGCGMMPLIGLRFHCETCGNYDLCNACKESRGHEHSLNLILPSYDDEDKH